MGMEKNLKRSDISYNDYIESDEDAFSVYSEHGETFTDIENFLVEERGYTFAEYEINRLLDFVSMGYCEIKYGKLTERMLGELKLDIRVWDSGMVDKFFFNDEERKLVYEHLKVIKDYLNKGIK